jgi:hypothetical protein
MFFAQACRALRKYSFRTRIIFMLKALKSEQDNAARGFLFLHNDRLLAEKTDKRRSNILFAMNKRK